MFLQPLACTNVYFSPKLLYQDSDRFIYEQWRHFVVSWLVLSMFQKNYVSHYIISLNFKLHIDTSSHRDYNFLGHYIRVCVWLVLLFIVWMYFCLNNLYLLFRQMKRKECMYTSVRRCLRSFIKKIIFVLKHIFITYSLFLLSE